MSRYWVVAGLLGLGLLAAPNAMAQDVLPNSTSGSVTYTFGVFTVTISGCNETSGDTTITNDCANEQVVGTISSKGSLVLTYEWDPLRRFTAQYHGTAAPTRTCR